MGRQRLGRGLLSYVQGKTYELAVWLGIYVGLRVGEIQGLLWEAFDFDTGCFTVKRTYVRRDKRFKEYPKGKKWHPVVMPIELLELLKREKSQAISEFVVTSPRREFLSYDGYFKALKRYAKAVGITKDVANHALRHSISGVWMEAGADESDIQALFAHSSNKVTERYIHFKTEKRLGRIANVIRLFPVGGNMPESDGLSSPNLPQDGLE